MIGRLRGIADMQGEDHIILDVNGVGYLVQCSLRTLHHLSANMKEPITLWIETHVREDCIRLFGFLEPMEREWFRLLQTVQGVGTRVALAMLSCFSNADLAHAIAAQDKQMVARAQGVGPKLAGRIVSELKGRIPAALSVLSEGDSNAPSPHLHMPQEAEDAISALVNLGYGRMQAMSAVETELRSGTEPMSAGALIRHALKTLAG